MERHLIIAPATDLEYAQAEVQRIANAGLPNVRLLIDNVTLRCVVDELSQPYDAIWFVSHGTQDGIQLEDGMLSPSLLVQLLRAHPPQLLVINTCSSLRVGIRAYEALRCAVVATLIDIPDLVAFVTTVRLAQALGRGLDVTKAYMEARPDENREYLLMNGHVAMNAKSKLDDTHRLLLRLYSKVDSMEERLSHVQEQAVMPLHARVAWVIGWIFLAAPLYLFLRLTSWYDMVHSPVFLWTLIAWGISAGFFGYALGLFKGKSQ